MIITIFICIAGLFIISQVMLIITKKINNKHIHYFELIDTCTIYKDGDTADQITGMVPKTKLEATIKSLV